MLKKIIISFAAFTIVVTVATSGGQGSKTQAEGLPPDPYGTHCIA